MSRPSPRPFPLPNAPGWSFALVAALAPSFAGCIIYEDKYDTGTWPTSTDGTSWTDPGTTPPDPTGPQLTDALALTVNEGLPGETVLSTMIAANPQIPLGSIVSVTFERDVTVSDRLDQQDEIVLLLSIADGADPGLVQVTVDTSSGDEYVLVEPFHILEPGPSCTPSTTTTTSTTGTDTGGSTDDTGGTSGTTTTTGTTTGGTTTGGTTTGDCP
ncbi:MAG: hypothetical protein ABMB14_17575 [Myxococcota bacterium]